MKTLRVLRNFSIVFVAWCLTPINYHFRAEIVMLFQFSSLIARLPLDRGNRSSTGAYLTFWGLFYYGKNESPHRYISYKFTKIF